MASDREYETVTVGDLLRLVLRKHPTSTGTWCNCDWHEMERHLFYATGVVLNERKARANHTTTV
jgi:hypothetical protein